MSTLSVNRYTEVPSSGSESDHLYAILQMGNKADKFLVSTKINGVDVEMKLDSRVNWSTVHILDIVPREINRSVQVGTY